MELHFAPAILLVFLVSGASTQMSSGSKSLYSEILGQTKYNLLLQNIAFPKEDYNEKRAKTFLQNPTDQISLWEGGDVPFMFSYSNYPGIEEDFTEEEKEIILKALKYISDNVPCLKFREVTISTPGDKLIFSTHGDSNPHPYDYCWSYLGLVGNMGSDTLSTAEGQVVHLNMDCFSFQTVVRLVGISLGLYQPQTEKNRNSTSETEESLSTMLALATLYKEHLKDDSCMKQENIPEYFDLLLKQSSDLQKYCHKGGYYLFLSDDHILRLPGFTKASCNIEPYPLGHHLLDLPHNYPLKYGLSGVVSAVVDGKLHVCGGGEYEGVASCHALHGTSWHGTPNLDIPRLNAESSMWQGGWLVTGGLLDRNTRHTTSELYKGGGWTAGPSLDEKTLLTRKPLMGVEGHCQVTAGGRVIVAGGNIPKGFSTGATFSWDGSSWSQLGNMRSSRAHHACVERDGVLFALGGGESLYVRRSVEKLNLATGVWTDGPELPYSVTYVQAVNIHGDIFVVGGEGSGGKIVKLVGDTWEFVSEYGFDGCGPITNPPILTANQVQCF